MNIPSKRDRAALAFPPSEFEYLLAKTPFRLILDAAEDTAEIYRDLCAVGQSLLKIRDRAQTAADRHWSPKLFLPKKLLNAETRALCERAEKNIRKSRELTAKMLLLVNQRRDIFSKNHASRTELGAVLHELFLPPGRDRP